MEVRLLVGSDVEAAMELCREVFEEYEASSHTEEGIEEFLDYIHPEWIRAAQAVGELLLWGCFTGGGELAGVLCLRPPRHISLLYVRGKHQRSGMARGLLGAAVQYVREAKLTDHLTINSPPNAGAACQSLGFVSTGPEELQNGMRFIPMQLELAR